MACRGDQPDRPACSIVQPHTQLRAKLVAYAATSSRIHLVDCSRIYLDSSAKRINPQLMPGGLHPSKAGATVRVRVRVSHVCREQSLCARGLGISRTRRTSASHQFGTMVASYLLQCMRTARHRRDALFSMLQDSRKRPNASHPSSTDCLGPQSRRHRRRRNCRQRRQPAISHRRRQALNQSCRRCRIFRLRHLRVSLRHQLTAQLIAQPQLQLARGTCTACEGPAACL